LLVEWKIRHNYFTWFHNKKIAISAGDKWIAGPVSAIRILFWFAAIIRTTFMAATGSFFLRNLH
jgi:hypothetical protein